MEQLIRFFWNRYKKDKNINVAKLCINARVKTSPYDTDVDAESILRARHEHENSERYSEEAILDLHNGWHEQMELRNYVNTRYNAIKRKPFCNYWYRQIFIDRTTIALLCASHGVVLTRSYKGFYDFLLYKLDELVNVSHLPKEHTTIEYLKKHKSSKKQIVKQVVQNIEHSLLQQQTL